MLTRALTYGVLGWLIEMAWTGGPRYSRALGGPDLAIPFLPVYALGGVVVGHLSPKMRGKGPLERLITYGLALTGVELGACAIDRWTGGESWSYDGDCIDLEHSIIWTALALATESH